MRTVACFFLAAASVSCSDLKPFVLPEAFGPETCRELYDRLDTEARGTWYESEPREFPYLRAGRLLASFRGELDDEEKMRVWLRGAESGGLGRYLDIRDQLSSSSSQMPRDLVRCGTLLLETELTDPAVRLRAVAEQDPDPVHDETQRRLGRFAFWLRPPAASAEALQREERTAAIRPENLVRWQPVLDRLPDGTRHRLESSDPLAAGLAALKTDIFGRPAMSIGHGQAILAEHAPQLLIETRGATDEPGHPGALHASAPVSWSQRWMFGALSHARARGHVLIRAQYTVWIGDRDSGALRGVVWRVTLWRDGLPLYYESVEADGGFYRVYRARQLPRAPEPSADLREAWEGGQPVEGAITLLIGSGDSRLLRVLGQQPAPAAGRSEAIEVVDGSADGLPRRLLDPQGILNLRCVERPLWYWASGVRKPGCARTSRDRQIANGGTRPFDDPLLPEALLGRELLARLP